MFYSSPQSWYNCAASNYEIIIFRQLKAGRNPSLTLSSMNADLYSNALSANDHYAGSMSEPGPDATEDWTESLAPARRSVETK